MSDQDAGIVREIREGNVRRFGALVDRHRDRAMTLALRIVGNREEAEELVQDSFVRAYRSLADFRGDSLFGTWFTRILYNVCLTRVSRRRNQETATEEEELPAPSDETDVLSKMEEKEMQEVITEEIARLPERYRTVITLFYVQEMAYGEIAQVTGHPLGTVKTNLCRGRTALRRRVLARLRESVEAA
jgi:RNA polymerase sigma factor (sigma-70 family)